MKNKNLTSKDIGATLHELKTALVSLYGKRLVSIILYGSYARAEADDDSDIDIMVVLKGEVSVSAEIDNMLDSITDMGLKYNTLISVYPVSEDALGTVKTPLILSVRREGIYV